MINEELLESFKKQFDELKEVVETSRHRTIGDPVDSFFYEHQNVFIKAYLVSACSMLEAFIQELVFAYVDCIREKVSVANIPLNMVTWSTNHEKAKMKFGALEIVNSRKDLSDMVSPNYWKTVKAFERIGVDLSNSDVISYKDSIASIVEKRNRIVHHNDDASDISFKDLLERIDEFKSYCVCLYSAVSSNIHLTH